MSSKLESLKKQVKLKRSKLAKSGDQGSLGILGETGISRPHQRILTGILSMDYLLGGFKPGTLIEFSGDENAGKTTLVWKITENLQNIYKAPAIFYNDVELTSNDEQFLNRFPMLKSGDIIYANIPKIESFFEQVEEFIENLDFVMLDSIAAMSSVNERSLDKSEMGKNAGIWSRGWKKLYDFSKKGAVFLAVNQVRDNLDAYASSKNGTQTTGGRALRHAKSAQIHVKKESKSKALKKKNFRGEEEICAWETVIEVQKNKQGSAFKSISTYLWTDDEKPETFDVVKEAINFGMSYGIIQRNSVKGSTYSFLNIFNNQEIVKVNGIQALEDHFYKTPIHLAWLKIFVYRYLFNDEFFYCLYDKILLIGKAEVFMMSKKYGIEVDFTEEKLLANFKKIFPLEYFIKKERLTELKEKYGEPWTWGILNGVEEDE